MSDSAAVIGRLSAVIAGTDGDIRQVDDILDELPSPLPPDLVGPLLLALVDDHPYDEVLWSVLHAAESAGPGGVYEGALVEVLPRLVRAAPGWARLVLIRCLNSDSSLKALSGTLAAASGSQARAVREVAEHLDSEDPERFEPAARTLITAARVREGRLH